MEIYPAKIYTARKKKILQGGTLMTRTETTDLNGKLCELLAEQRAEGQIKLNGTSRDRVMEAISNPPQPNERLRKAAQRLRNMA